MRKRATKSQDAIADAVAEVVRLQALTRRHPNSHEFGYAPSRRRDPLIGSFIALLGQLLPNGFGPWTATVVIEVLAPQHSRFLFAS